jgi:hypothetical protein
MKRVRFGECVLDSDTRQLSVRGQAVHLSPLLENRPRAVSKSESPSKPVRAGELMPIVFEIVATDQAGPAEHRRSLRKLEVATS